MDSSLQKRILNDLEKSGFGSEMQAVRCAANRGWRCSPAYVYVDKDSQQGREMDLLADHWTRKDLERDECIVSFYHIVADVKKSDRPWVVFGQRFPEGHRERSDGWNNLAFCEGPRDWYPDLADTLSQHSLMTEQGFHGYAVHESFKDPRDRSQWYSAFVSVCKAGEHVLSTETKHRRPEADYSPGKLTGSCFTFVQPLVILDATLIGAELNRSGDVELFETDEVPFRFVYRSPQYQKLSYRVDLVRLSALDTYLLRCEKRQAAMVAALHSLAREMSVAAHEFD